MELNILQEQYIQQHTMISFSIKTMFTILMLFANLYIVSCFFHPILQTSVYSPPGAQAISPAKRYSNPKIVYYDQNDRNVIIRNIDGKGETTTFRKNQTVTNIEWLNSKKIYLAGSDWIQIIDDQTFITYMSVSLPSQLSAYKICVSKGTNVRIAVMTDFKEITIYGSDSYQLKINTQGPISAIGLDYMGKYLYYVQSGSGYNRVVFDIDSNTKFNTVYGVQPIKQIITSPNQNNMDIMVGLSNSQIQIFDDYIKLFYYWTGSNSYQSVRFSDDGNYIYGYTEYSIIFWRASYDNFDRWYSNDNVFEFNDADEKIQAFTLGSGYIAIYSSYNYLYVYEDTYKISISIFIIIAVVVVLVIATGFIVYICKKRRNNLENRLIGPQGSNVVVVGQANNNPYVIVDQNDVNRQQPQQYYANPANQNGQYYMNQNNQQNGQHQQYNNNNYNNYQPPRNW